MCTVSMVIADWQNPLSPNHIPKWEPEKPLPPSIDWETAKMMLDVLRRLDAIDKKLGAIDCKLKEPEKARVVRQLKRRVASGKRKQP